MVGYILPSDGALPNDTHLLISTGLRGPMAHARGRAQKFKGFFPQRRLVVSVVGGILFSR